MGTVRPDQPEPARGGRRWILAAGAFVFLALLAWVSVLTLPYRQRSDGEHTAHTPPRKPNVVLFLIDTLRADRLGVYGYPGPTSPNLDALAG